MPKTHQFTEEHLDQVAALRKETKNAALARKLQVLELRLSGYKNAEIAKITKYSKSRVSALVCVFANEGLEYFKKEQRLGGNHRYLSVEDEAKLLEMFENAAKAGQMIETGEIARAYAEKVGHEVDKSQIYRVLARHGWRKIMPRSQHPNKASEEAIEASKKLTFGWEK